jgi:hypothetical protein
MKIQPEVGKSVGFGNTSTMMKNSQNIALGKMGTIGDTIESGHMPAAGHHRGKSDALG